MKLNPYPSGHLFLFMPPSPKHTLLPQNNVAKTGNIHTNNKNIHMNDKIFFSTEHYDFNGDCFLKIKIQNKLIWKRDTRRLHWNVLLTRLFSTNKIKKWLNAKCSLIENCINSYYFQWSYPTKGCSSRYCQRLTHSASTYKFSHGQTRSSVSTSFVNQW